ncbi:MAG: shikimate kinase [Actinomycetota bacterium]|jgi:shikimate kinase
MSPVAIIVGAPGAGKTTVGRLLAKKLNVDFRDTDVDIENSAGKSITDVFVENGEAEFRAMEIDAIARALEEHDGVVSLGGGAVLSAVTRERLHGLPVVWLQVDLSNAANRVGINTARPLLLGNVRGTLKKLMDEREPLYSEVATIVIDTSDKSPAAIVDEIASQLV